jgi:hypothetical protein
MNLYPWLGPRSIGIALFLSRMQKEGPFIVVEKMPKSLALRHYLS